VSEHELSRRQFLLAGALGALLPATLSAEDPPQGKPGPLFVATWPHGLPASKKAGQVLAAGGSLLDALEQGVNLSELDPQVRSVGLGGLPNAAGVVELDAAIIDGESGEAGSVASLQEIATPVSVARKVMEQTRHVMLVGPGAQAFALAQGFKKQNLLTPRSKRSWERWKKRVGKQGEGHDTIGMIGMDAARRVAAVCTTSGLAWKMPGRVGDSPLIGAGLYARKGVGAATATGVGEEVIKICGSFLVVEEMARGRTPQQAVEAACARIIARSGRKHQVAFLAIDVRGRIGAASIKRGFSFAVWQGGSAVMKQGKVAGL